MKKPVQPLLKTQIRPVEASDFASMRRLAAEFPSFTVPPEYILWFLMTFHPDYCRILENDSGEFKGYLLAMPTSTPSNGIAIWQVAAATPHLAIALEFFAAYLRDLVALTHATSVYFTTSPDSAFLRLIHSLASQFGECTMKQLNLVPTGQGEYEFELSISPRVRN